MAWFRRGSKPGRWHPGIQLRISTLNGPIVEADSANLYYSAKFGAAGEPCDPSCMPGCQKHGWVNLVAGDGGFGMIWPGSDFSVVPLKIEMRAAKLYDPRA
jgi:hypothetical protein